MSMLPADLDDFENDIHETFLEIGDYEAMDIFDFVMPSTTGVYKEQKFKTYRKQVSLTGRIKLSPKQEELSDAGRRKECSCVFTFDTKQLKDAGVVHVDDKGREVSSITLDSVIRYKGMYYEVLNICPQAMIGDRFILYKYECKEFDTTKCSFDEGGDSNE